jgi:hypothetical protein
MLNRGTHVVYAWNKNIAFEEQISSTQGTPILRSRNNSCLLGEHVLFTHGTRILSQRNTCRLRREQEYEQISPTQGTSITS